MKNQTNDELLLWQCEKQLINCLSPNLKVITSYLTRAAVKVRNPRNWLRLATDLHKAEVITGKLAFWRTMWLTWWGLKPLKNFNFKKAFELLTYFRNNSMFLRSFTVNTEILRTCTVLLENSKQFIKRQISKTVLNNDFDSERFLLFCKLFSSGFPHVALSVFDWGNYCLNLESCFILNKPKA